MRRPSPSGLWLDRALCVLLALLSFAALIYGVLTEHPGIAGGGAFGLIGALGAAMVLFDEEALRRSRALQAAREREWR
ncbi:hypothetical protein [Variovorax sp. PAMC26660]|uniref:hypothetical protein n=1 Tax=Variovorax sp. PAMC26660 TaxID=2762322 RepID=UPI00164D48BA|nr:hypothetical protein [Variovorax sp. PAMC26660]QNK67667.1 hypothetical protein H7F35_31780 [Variovorax sp. PAMC26660]